ncbi:MAG TPA: hypothetical protein VK427_14595, partial [Kofleriaceae bacterium]|nr:hypothetical protein [Kofleriaceae bacterium]
MTVHMGGIIALAIAALGVSFAILIYRAAPRRRDNVVFAALAGVDALITAWRGLNVVAGESIVESATAIPCEVLAVVLSTLTVEFITAFPRRPAMAWRWRALLWAWGACTLLILFVHPSSERVMAWFFFLPSLAMNLVLGYRAWTRTHERDARTVIGTLWFRWIFGCTCYYLAPLVGLFEAAVWAETTVATTLTFVVIGTAVLRSELFSIRSTLAESFTLGTIALLVILGGGTAIWVVQRYTEVGTTLHQALLVGATLVPLALAATSYALYPRVERRVLAGLDERRARRLSVQGDPLPPAPGDAIAEAKRRIS